jgi:hypothetical protein
VGLAVRFVPSATGASRPSAGGGRLQPERGFPAPATWKAQGIPRRIRGVVVCWNDRRIGAVIERGPFLGRAWQITTPAASAVRVFLERDWS